MIEPQLSIILLTKNGGDLFGEVLDALFNCDGMASAEVVQIDSGSTDSTLAHSARHPQIRLHRIPAAEFGHGRTRNLGARLSRGRTLVYLVQDATPVAREFLQRLTAPLADPEVAAVYGRQLPRPWTNRLERFFLGETYPDERRIRFHGGRGPMRIEDIFFSNVASAIRRESWERFPFQEDLIMSEDQQWAKEVLRAGSRIVYEPAAAVYHSHNYSLAELFRRNFDSGYSLLGIVEDSFWRMAGYEIRHLAAGIRDLTASRDVAWIPYFLVYESTKSAGFSLGQRARWLPRWLRRALSLHRQYWSIAEGGAHAATPAVPDPERTTARPDRGTRSRVGRDPLPQ